MTKGWGGRRSSSGQRLRLAMLVMGCTVFVLTAAWVATAPVSICV